MIDLFAMFWTVLILSSIYWYGFLVFYVGIKAGREIRVLTRTLANRPQPADPPNPEASSRG